MKIIRKYSLWLGLIIVVWLIPCQAAALNGITITTPHTGATVAPGQVVPVTVQPLGTFVLSTVLIVTPVDVQLAEQPPFTVNLVIPQTAVGALTIRALGKDPSSTVVSSDITITVHPTAPLQALQVDPSQFHFAALGAQKQISVSGMYEDGIIRDLARAGTGTSYHSSNSAVMTVSPSGVMHAQGDGMSTVTVTNAGIGATVNVTVVGQGSLVGDLDRNGVVDCNDLAIVKAALGKQSDQPGFDPRADTNGDGVVNVKDLAFVAQKLPAGTRCP